MDHKENLTQYVANFVDELAKNDISHVVISPGSRSTPLAMLMTKHPQIKEWILVDERSAAFFALGIAKQLNQPVALVCTSGTAAANYYPAIIEAKYSRVPLLVLTADRPHELRDVGATQTINQINMYGEYVNYFQEMALPEATEAMIHYVRSRASRAVIEAMQENKGPVHLNFPFREPLVPKMGDLNALFNKTAHKHHERYEGKKCLSDVSIDTFVNKVANKQKGLIVCGPQTDVTLAKEIVKLANAWQVPLIADPLSQIRSLKTDDTIIIDSYDAFFKNESIRKRLKPDFIIRFGAMPISKSYLFFVSQHKDTLQFVIENDSEPREPTNIETEFIFSDAIIFSQMIRKKASLKIDKKWLSSWKEINQIARQFVNNVSSATLTEGETVREVVQQMPQKSNLFVSNSMPVRDLDTFFTVTDNEIFVHGNRGVSGIDGIISTALGIAAASNKRVTLIVGDLAFYHDLNGLLTQVHYDLNLTIVLMNNDGGGIFSFLPQVKEEKYFEKLFGTPLNIDFEHAVNLYKGKYYLATTKKELVESLQTSYKTDGLTVIEIQTDRSENMKWHRRLWKKIEEEILTYVK